MKLLDFGSLNIDHTYQLPHLVKEGETLSSTKYQRSEGGKGFNQAVALAKAGQEVFFAGALGSDGKFLQEYLNTLSINTDHLQFLDAPTGHAIIQLDDSGRNSIILFGGTNVLITKEMIDETLVHFECGDYILLQNEISHGDYLIHAAHEKGMHVILNPSPISPALLSWPLEKVEWLILNEIEGSDITGKYEPNEILDEILRRFPQIHVVLTLGAQGSLYADAGQRVSQNAIRSEAVDTTAAGDTFTGYFIHAMLQGENIQAALRMASYASSIAVSRHGASRSVPWKKEVLASMAGTEDD